MKLAEKMSLLAELGIIDLLESEEFHSNLEILVGGIAKYILEDRTVLDFMPPSILDDQCLEVHFSESGYDLDWVDFLSGSFKEMVKCEASNMVIANFDQHLLDHSAEFLERYIIEWVEGWCSNCRRAFRAALAEMICPTNKLESIDVAFYGPKASGEPG